MDTETRRTYPRARRTTTALARRDTGPLDVEAWTPRASSGAWVAHRYLRPDMTLSTTAWAVTHAPTGLGLGAIGLTTRRDAVALAAWVDTVAPLDVDPRSVGQDVVDARTTFYRWQTATDPGSGSSEPAPTAPWDTPTTDA